MTLSKLGLVFLIAGSVAVLASLIGYWFIDAGEVQMQFRWFSAMTALAGLMSLAVGIAIRKTSKK